MSGISYWTKKDSKKLMNLLDSMIETRGFKDLFWDDLIKDNPNKFNIDIYKIKSSDWFEMDTLDDLQKAEKLYRKKD